MLGGFGCCDGAARLVGDGMINPTQEDIGRAVVYDPGHGEGQDGTLVKYSDTTPGYCHVRYGHNDSSTQLTACADLHWFSGKDAQ